VSRGPLPGAAVLPPPETSEERRLNGLLLQEDRDYANGWRLEIRRSARGGRGFDVFLITDGATRNISDCGDDACGQPSLAPDAGRCSTSARPVER